jgi:thioredoxin-related protein
MKIISQSNYIECWVGLKNKEQPTLLLTRKVFQWKETLAYCERVKKKIFQANGLQKQAGVAMLIYDKADFRLKLVK